MHVFDATEDMEAPCAGVWQALSEPEIMSAWMPGIDGMRSTSGQSLALGSELRFEARGRERASKVVEFDPGRVIALRSTQGSFTATYRYTVAPRDGGSRVTLTADCEARGFMRLFAPLLRPLIRRVDGGQLRHLHDFVRGS